MLDSGSFSSLDNQVDTQTGTVRAKARFDNTAGTLFPSQFVNVQLQLRTIEGAVVVPVTAVRHGANGDYVYVLNDDRTVTLRPASRAATATVDKVAIANGLQAGEKVITEGADRLQATARAWCCRRRARRRRGAAGAARRPRGAAHVAPAGATAVARCGSRCRAAHAAEAAAATERRAAGLRPPAAGAPAAAAARSAPAPSAGAGAAHPRRRMSPSRPFIQRPVATRC